ncbi:hypothetical protein SM124_11625 [Bacillus sp. 31A1R]|uniref:Uncharacterized protein n=1 Tax=Robertmurraya mangrovi TaxID=3098077 RepID=A0ABU5IZ41_9BACI|nr:hypothetical protein [Bacillus sp. 31A1R]MDZ5472397.1 hypothetical protein [Bacillus sp. 31A1R]
MKILIVSILAILFVVAPNKAEATIPGYTVIAKSDKDNITIYAKKMDGLYYDFKIDFKGKVFSRPFWMNATNPTYAPEIYYEDINNDEKKELIIILTKDYGTGVLDQEVSVFHINHKRFGEVLVDHPMAIVNKNIKASLTPSKAEITIGKKQYLINVKELKLLPETVFDEINFESIIKYEVKNNKLTATLHPQFSPGAFVGSILITYEYRDKMYQAKSIEFQLKDF